MATWLRRFAGWYAGPGRRVKRSAYYALRDAQKQASEDVINQNDLDISNANRARDQFSIYDPATGKRDEAATNNAMLAVDKIIPGYSTMGEQSRKQHVGQATALADIYSRSRIGREQGFEQLVAGKEASAGQNAGLQRAAP